GGVGPFTFTGDTSGTTSYIDIGNAGAAGTLLNLLASNHVTVSTNAAGVAGTRNITVQDAIIWAASTNLTFQAHDSVIINAPITNTSNAYRGITFNADDVEINAAITRNNGYVQFIPISS